MVITSSARAVCMQIFYSAPHPLIPPAWLFSGQLQGVLLLHQSSSLCETPEQHWRLQTPALLGTLLPTLCSTKPTASSPLLLLSALLSLPLSQRRCHTERIWPHILPTASKTCTGTVLYSWQQLFCIFFYHLTIEEKRVNAIFIAPLCLRLEVQLYFKRWLWLPCRQDAKWTMFLKTTCRTPVRESSMKQRMFMFEHSPEVLTDSLKF